MKCLYAFGFMLTALVLSASCDTIIENRQLDYLIYLPDHWVKTELNDSQHIFFDTTNEYASRLSIVSHTLDTSVYDSSEAWTRAHYIAYKTYIDLESYPFGTVLYADSSRSTAANTAWACELYARFFSFDSTMFAWDEYVRYSASPERGYEMYMLGDTTDMKTNIGLYGAIIQAVEIGRESANNSINMPSTDRFSNRSLSARQQTRIALACSRFDIRGRELTGPTAGASTLTLSKIGNKTYRYFNLHW